MSHFIDIVHAVFGLLFILAGIRVFVEVQNANEGNVARVRCLCYGVAGLMWAVCLIGGYFYVTAYAPEKAVILKGPWPLAHKLVMETKEHVVFTMVLLATFLPILASNDFLRNRVARSLMLWVTGVMVALGVSVEIAGNIISMGARIALMPN